MRRLLAPVLLPEPQPDGALRARIEDAYDPTTGHIVQKAVRFRIDFTVSGGGAAPAVVVVVTAVVITKAAPAVVGAL